MSSFYEAAGRDTVIFVNSVRPSTFDALSTYETRYGKKLNMVILVDSKKKKAISELNKTNDHKNMTVETVDYSSPVAISKVLKKYEGRLLAVTCQFENSIPYYEKLVPHVPYLDTPTQSSLEWSTDKVVMRKMLEQQNPKLVPKYVVVRDTDKASLDKIEKKVGYPVIIKPAGLAASLLISIAYTREELELHLQRTLRTINKTYKTMLGRGTPKIMIEEFMDGNMYSMEVYVNGRGTMYPTPLVYIKTGRAVGFDDFFGYQQMTPSKLKPYHVNEAAKVATEAVRALRLRACTAHVELMRTDKGWKIIELAPRMGGFRHSMYDRAYGMNHILNDLLIRIPQKPVIPKKVKGHTATFKIYAKSEGTLKGIGGVKKVRALDSFVDIEINKSIGDTLKFAKNGGSPVIVLAMFNESRQKLMADIGAMERMLEFEVVSSQKRNKIISG